MRCPYCKTRVDEGGIVCVKCGHRLPRMGEQVRVRGERYILSQIAVLGGVAVIIGFFSNWIRIELVNTEVSGLSVVALFPAMIGWFSSIFKLGGNVGQLLTIANYGIYCLMFLPLAGLTSLLTLWNKRWAVWLVFTFSLLGLLSLAAVTGVGWYVLQKTQPPIFIGFWLTWAGALWLWLSAILDLIINRGRRTVLVTRDETPSTKG